MTEVSGRLRAARERAGLTIQDISAITKIRQGALQAIERGEFERLPGDFYVRAFLKTYAREVGLPADEIVHDYDAGRRPAQPQPEEFSDEPSPSLAAESSPKSRRVHRVAPANVPAPAEAAQRQRPLPAPWQVILSMPRNIQVAGALAVMLLAIILLRNSPVANRPHDPGAVGTSGVAAVAPVATTGTVPAPAAPEKLTLAISPTAPIWVTGAADGKRVLYRLLVPGEHVTVEARKDLTFRIGNAAAFSYAINGVPGKPLGGPDEIREFQITPENFQSFRR